MCARVYDVLYGVCCYISCVCVYNIYIVLHVAHGDFHINTRTNLEHCLLTALHYSEKRAPNVRLRRFRTSFILGGGGVSGAQETGGGEGGA